MKFEPIILQIRTTTPLWTGGVDRTMDTIHESSIVGSLRWWYEAIVRGLGGYACDPTTNECNYDENKYAQSAATTKNLKLRDAGLCDACQVFGATGWKRRFRLDVEIIEKNLENVGILTTTGDNRVTKDRQGNTKRPKWFFSGPKYFRGVFNLHIVPLCDRDFDPFLIYGVLKLIENYGGLAAKNQLGCGGIHITQVLKHNKIELERQFDATEFVQRIPWATSPKTDTSLPSLATMFFLNLGVQEKGIQPLLNLKYDIRQRIRAEYNDKAIRHFICGTAGWENIGSKIFGLQEVNGQMRLWGWLPEKLGTYLPISRNDILNVLKDEFGQFGTLPKDSWKEFSSKRDESHQSLPYVKDFLIALLENR